MVESERFFTEPERGVRRGAATSSACPHLGRPAVRAAQRPAARPSDMDPASARELTAHYAPHDERAGALAGPHAVVAQPMTDRRGPGRRDAARRARAPPGAAWPTWPAPALAGGAGVVVTWLVARGARRRAGRRVLRRHRRVRARPAAWPSWAPRPGWSTGRPGCAPPGRDAPARRLPADRAGPGACCPVRWPWRCGWARRRSPGSPPADAPHVIAEHTAGLRVLAVFLPLQVLTDALLAATRGYRAMRPDRAARPGRSAARCSCCWSARSASRSLLDDRARCRPFALAWAAPYLPVARPGRRTRCAASTVDGARPRPRSRARRTRGCAATSGGSPARAPLASVAQLALQRVDVLLVAALGGLAAAALYAVAGRFVVLGQFANQGISQSVQPRLAEALATGDRADREPPLPDRDRLAGAGHLADVPAGDRCSRRSTWGCSATRTRAGAPVVVVLAAAMLVATGCGMVDMVLAMAGRTSWNLVNVLVALAVTIGLDVLLIPRVRRARRGDRAGLRDGRQQPAAADPGRPGACGCTRSAPGPAPPRLLSVGCFGVLPRVVTALTGPAPPASRSRSPSPCPPSASAPGCCATGSRSTPSPADAQPSRRTA